MQLHLGYFVDFKGADTLVVAGEVPAIEHLAHTVELFVQGGQGSAPLDEHVFQLSKAQLWLTAEPVPVQGRLSWFVGGPEGQKVAAKLRAVAHRAPAHQYFELVGSEAKLMVAAGEYPSEWWRAQA